jgi:hypothetical protein
LIAAGRNVVKTAEVVSVATIGYGYGSEWHLLQHLGRRRAAFSELIEKRTGCERIIWRDFEELRESGTELLKLRETVGLEFLEAEDPARLAWEHLWPQSGSVHNWDAVGRAEAGTWILLEAKAHVGELKSHCAATSEKSLGQIRTTLDDTKRELWAEDAGDWTKDYYQYCNRLALLHFLLKHGVDARLVFVYFLGDREDLGRAGRKCPASEAGWSEALEAQDRHVGVPSSSPILRRIHSVFVPAYSANLAEEILRPEYGGKKHDAGLR